MADTTSPLDTKRLLSPWDMTRRDTVATGVAIVKGTPVSFNSSGLLVPGNNAGATHAVGVADEGLPSTAPAGSKIKWSQGIFRFTGASLTAADREGPCYLADNQTVNATNTNKLAGLVHDVPATNVVDVLIVGAINKAFLS